MAKGYDLMKLVGGFSWYQLLWCFNSFVKFGLVLLFKKVYVKSRQNVGRLSARIATKIAKFRRLLLKKCEQIEKIRDENLLNFWRRRSADWSPKVQRPGPAASLRFDCFFAGALFVARMTLRSRSAFRGFQIGFKRCKGSAFHVFQTGFRRCTGMQIW